MVTNVGRKVPSIDPMVLQALSLPTTVALSSSESVAFLTRPGVTVPSRNSGGTKTIMQLMKAATTRKFVDTVTMSSPDTAMMTYLPTNGIRAIHTAAARMRV